MPSLYLVVDLIVVVALIGLGVTVLLQNSRSALNRFFALFVASVGIWIIANYISNDISISSRAAVIANYFVFCFSYAAAYFLLRFTIVLAEAKKAAKLFKWLTLPLLLVAISTFTPWVITGATVQGDVYALSFGPLATLYFSVLGFLVISILWVLGTSIRHSKGNQKARLKLLFISACTALPLLLLTEAVLPSLTGWFGLTNVGITPMLIIVFALYYGVVKHKLFDLRFLIVRSLAYVITLGLISLTYGAISYYITTLISKGHTASLEALNIVLIIVAIIAYSPLKKVFDRLTNRFFYRDAYDPQGLYDELNRTLVASLDLNVVLGRSAKIIAENLKAEHCTFILKKTEYREQRKIGIGDTKKSDTKKWEAMLRGMDSIVAIDYLQPHHQRLKTVLEDSGIAVVVSLTSNPHKNEEGLGYLLLGNRKSGNPYTTQDLRVLDTLAKELTIAVQNALHFEEIQNFNLTLQGRVDDATKKLRRANEKLREMDETKDDFISMASHQLRTPLTSVKGYISMVLEGDAGKITHMQREMLGQAFFSSQRMVYLIADLLNVSRLKTGKFIIESTPVDLAEVVEQELSQLEETAAAHSLTLQYDKPKHFPTLMLDETKTRQVIMNFVDNAIYYTPNGGHIGVELTDNRSTIELRVKDNGIGVPKREQPHLFTKFYRADNARKARPDGTGLGLFMAKKVIVAQGGSIVFDSQEGKGSTFGFIFSKHKLGAKPAPTGKEAGKKPEPVASEQIT